MAGTPTEHAEHWKVPEIVEFALKFMALTFRNTFVLQQWKEVIHSMRPAIDGQT